MASSFFSDSSFFLSPTERAPMSFSQGTSLLDGRYLVKRLIGEGSFGVVFQVCDTFRHTDVALKVVSKVPEELALPVLEHECRVQAQLTDHSHVLKTFDLHKIRHRGRSFLALTMEYAPGGSAWDWVKRHRYDHATRLSQGLDLCEQMLRGVASYHSVGIAHLDLHFGNFVIAKDGRIKLTDSGCGQYFRSSNDGNHCHSAFSGSSSLSVPRPSDLWEAGYYSSKAAIGVDVYALGCLFYTVLHPDCRSPSGAAIYHSWRTGLSLLPPPLVGVPTEVARVIARCMERLT